jgi:hypothetical protein
LHKWLTGGYALEAADQTDEIAPRANSNYDFEED